MVLAHFSPELAIKLGQYEDVIITTKKKKKIPGCLIKPCIGRWHVFGRLYVLHPINEGQKLWKESEVLPRWYYWKAKKDLNYRRTEEDLIRLLILLLFFLFCLFSYKMAKHWPLNIHNDEIMQISWFCYWYSKYKYKYIYIFL